MNGAKNEELRHNQWRYQWRTAQAATSWMKSKDINNTKAKNDQRGYCQVCHQDPTYKQWRDWIWVLEWNDPSIICQCCSSSINIVWQKTWSHRPNNKVHLICHISNSNSMGRPGWYWFKSNHWYTCHNHSHPTGQLETGWRTPNLWKCRNHGWGPQATNNLNYWRHLHCRTLQ